MLGNKRVPGCHQVHRKDLRLRVHLSRIWFRCGPKALRRQSLWEIAINAILLVDWISLALKCCNRTGRWLHEKPANNALKKQQSLNYLLRVSVKDLLTLPLAIMFRCSFFTCFRLREALTNIIRPTWPDLFGMNMRSVYSDHTLNALLSSASTFCRGKFRGYLLILYVSFFTRHLEPVTCENGDGALKKCGKYLRRYLPLLSTPILSRFYSFAWFALLRMLL